MEYSGHSCMKPSGGGSSSVSEPATKGIKGKISFFPVFCIFACLLLSLLSLCICGDRVRKMIYGLTDDEQGVFQIKERGCESNL